MAEPAPARRAAIAATIRRLAMQRDLGSLATVAALSAAELAAADRARCLFFDLEGDLLWSESTGDATAGSEEHRGDRGLAGQAAHVGRACWTAHAEREPAFVAAIDDPWARGGERVLAQPVVSMHGETHAVVVVVREADRPMFEAADAAVLAEWASHAAPLFHAFELEASAGPPPGTGTIYRAEAVAARREGAGGDGEPLADAPPWTRAAHALVLVFVLAAVAYLALASVSEHASGPAVVVAASHRDVVAAHAGVMGAIAVEPGMHVRAGDLVAEHASEAEHAELLRAEDDLEHALAARLRDPTDRALEHRVVERKSVVDMARARLEARRIHAPCDGVVADVRTHVGQAVGPGHTVLTLVTGDREGPTIRAFVPGRFGPALAPGQRLVLDLDGFAHASQHLRVTAVGSEVLGPAEMQRIVGPELADAVPRGGSVVLVEAVLASASLHVDGRTLVVKDGMLGHAEVEVGRKRLLFAWFPRLEDWLFDD